MPPWWLALGDRLTRQQRHTPMYLVAYKPVGESAAVAGAGGGVDMGVDMGVDISVEVQGTGTARR